MASNTDVRTAGNLLLDALGAEEREQLLDGATRRPIEVGRYVAQAGRRGTTVVFPTSGVRSMPADTGDSVLESATISSKSSSPTCSGCAGRRSRSRPGAAGRRADRVTRGSITIVDREGLEEAACSCYEMCGSRTHGSCP